ncbi:MAG: hypothetical protein LIP01_07845 [Tannerellaceae bacterium]|nr:hypothetical protein [Tannerellaceae bacterium]
MILVIPIIIKKDYQQNSYPKEHNKNGAFNDLHLMQEVYYTGGRGIKASLYAWYMHSDRGIPMLNVDYKEESKSRNTQVESTLRVGGDWNKIRGSLKYGFKAGYTYTDLNYTYLADVGTEELSEMVNSQSYVHSFMAQAEGEYSWWNKWMLTGRLTGYQHAVESVDRSIITTAGNTATVGYDKARTELAGLLSLRYTPVECLGIAVNLREEYFGECTPLIPAAFVDYLVIRRSNVLVKASIVRNYRYPTLNDLYLCREVMIPCAQRKDIHMMEE